MAEFLLEALSEEIPARMQKRAAAEFSQIFTSELEKVGLAYETANYFVTPRRIAISIDGIPTYRAQDLTRHATLLPRTQPRYYVKA